MRTEHSGIRRTHDLEVLHGTQSLTPESTGEGRLAQERRRHRSDSDRRDCDRHCTTRGDDDDDGSASLKAAVDVLDELHEARLQLLWLRARLLTSPSRQEPEHLALSLRSQTDATETALSCIEAVLRDIEIGG